VGQAQRQSQSQARRSAAVASMLLQTTGGATHAPGTSRPAGLSLLPPLSSSPPPPPRCRGAVQGLHQALGGQGQAALVALQRGGEAVESPVEVRAGLCAAPSRADGGATCRCELLLLSVSHQTSAGVNEIKAQ